MGKCHVCGNEKFTEKLVKETLEIDGKLIIVEDIPAQGKRSRWRNHF